MSEKIDEIISFLNNYDFGGEYNCAIDNHIELLQRYGVDNGYWEICRMSGDLVETAGGLDDFLEEYYKSVIKSVCNVLETYKK